MTSIKNHTVHPTLNIPVIFEFFPTESFEELRNSGKKVNQSVGLCFHKDKVVVVRVGTEKWVYPGGGIEKGETFEEAMIREAHEEANVNVLKMIPLGYQSVKEGEKEVIYQTRYYCQVEPYSDFVSDPDGDITEVKWIDPAEYKQYVDWGNVGDYLIKEAVRLNKLNQ